MKRRLNRRHKELVWLLKEARLKAGLTQGELCALINRDRNFVSTVELGTRMLGVLEFCEYAEAVGLRPTELLGRALRAGKARPVVVRVGRPRKAGIGR